MSFTPHATKRQRIDDTTTVVPDSTTTPDRSTPYLYRHALESIFAFMTLGGLAVAMAVSRDWNRAVATMHSIGGVMCVKHGAHLVNICMSSLARHIGTVTGPTVKRQFQIDTPHVYLMRLHMSNLHTLQCEFTTSVVDAPIYFPPTLTFLNASLRFNREMVRGTDVSNLIRAVSVLHRIRKVSLDVGTIDYTHFSAIDFSCFANTPSLRELCVGPFSTFTSLHFEQFRSIPCLEFINLRVHAWEIQQLLRAPHQLQLHTLYIIGPNDAAEIDPVATLPTLTSLNLSSQKYSTLLHVFRSIPHVVNLNVRTFAVDDDDTEQISAVTALQNRCASLTHLQLANSYTVRSIHLRNIMVCMPLLVKLELYDLSELDSFEWLTVPSLICTLKWLTICSCNMTAGDMQYIGELKQLTSLNITCSFVQTIDEPLRTQFSIPSLLLPNLVELHLAQHCALTHEHHNFGHLYD